MTTPSAPWARDSLSKATMPEATQSATDMNELRAIAESARQWLASEEGQSAVRDVFQEARTECERFDRDARVSRETLRDPITL